MCCAGTKPHIPYRGLVIYEFEITPLLHSSQMSHQKHQLDH